MREDCVNVGLLYFSSHHQHVSTAQRGNWFAKNSRREKFLIWKSVGSIEHHNVQIASERKMLKAIVQKKNVNRPLLFDALTFGEAIFANPERNTSLKAML